jgi:DNA-binding IclR family transcriptional regulator
MMQKHQRLETKPLQMELDMEEILKYLRKNGERLDKDIATATGIPLETVRIHLTELSNKGEVMTCHSTRYVKGKKIEGLKCRVTGITPQAAPGRKSNGKTQLTLT